MVYTARKLINRAFYLSNVVADGFETVSGYQESEGLDLLNALLEIKTIDSRMIQNYEDYSGVFIPGQEKYFIPRLIPGKTFTFKFSEVRFPMQRMERGRYFNQARAENFTTLPNTYYLERSTGGANLYVYPFPDQAYPFQLHAKFAYPEILSVNQDLTAAPMNLDRYYIEYLRYALAEYICQEYNINLQTQSQSKLNELEKQLIDENSIDLTSNIRSPFRTSSGFNWGFINISPGWRP